MSTAGTAHVVCSPGPVVAAAAGVRRVGVTITRNRSDNYTPSDPELTNSDVSSLDTELDNYLREPRIPRSANIYAYWHSSQFPRLEPASRKYLSAPPTSVASEQLLSAAGQIYSDRPSNLLGENAEKQQFLSYNIRLFNYDY